MPFVDDMAAGLVAIYAQYGETATWAGVEGVTVIRDEGPRDVTMGHGRARLASVILAVRVSEVAAPQPGDVVTATAGPAAGVSFVLIADSEPVLDDLGLEWTCEAERQ
jgi:hypothetical protein